MQQRTGCLYLCPTPIGNLEDITLRVLRVLKEADLIAAEDTRRTKKLLTYYDIITPLTSYREHNRRKKGAEIISLLKEGKAVALVSDAGMPAISDPGYDLVVSALAEDIQVEALPGPSALLTALIASGIPPVPFAFWGFLPLRGKKRREALQELSLEKKTVIIYEAPHRICGTLSEIFACCGNRQAALGRELTKKFAEVQRGSLKEIMEAYQNREARGEYTIVLAGRETAPVTEEEKPLSSLKEDVDILVGKGSSRKEALKEAAKERGISRREAYETYHDLKK